MRSRLLQFFRKIYTYIIARFEKPATMLLQSYASLQSELTQARRALNEAINAEKRLSLELQKRKNENKDLTEVETRISTQKEITESHKQRLREVSSEIERAYLDKQMRIVRDKHNR